MQLKERKTNEIYTIGTTDFSDCNEEFVNEIKGSFGNGLNECSVVIRGNEGMIPHCHVISKDGRWQSCPCLYDALYFNHAEYQGKFTQKQKKKFNEWMMQISDADPKNTNWELLCILWKVSNNPLKNVPYKPKQPDYTKLENMIG